MLKELVDIGEYAFGLYSEVESYIEKPSGKFNIFCLLFDGENFKFEFKEGDKQDLIGICFKPAKGRVKAVLPVVNNLNIDKKTNKINIKALYETLDELKKDFSFVNNIEEKLKTYNFSTIIEKLQNLPKKDENKKIITNIFTLKLTKDYINKLGLTINEDKESYYFGEIEEFKNYFLQKVKGEGAKLEKGFCYVCEQHKDNLINFQKSKGVNFPYKFYNLDKPGFAYELDNEKKGYKSFGICQECYNKIKIGYNYFKNNLYKNVLGKKAYLFPSIYFSNKEKIKKIYSLFDKYSDSKKISKLEENIKQNQQEEKNISNDFLENIFNFSTDEEKQIVNSFVKFNFLFGYIDASNSDTLKINYFIKEVLPSKIISYYKSLPKNKYDKYYFELLKKLFGENIKENFKDSLLNNNLRLFPSYKKGEKIWSVYEFFKQISENDYYYFLDKILHNEQIDDKFVFKLITEQLKEGLKNDKKENNKNNLVFDVWKLFQIIEWLKRNGYLSYKQNKMNEINFNTNDDKLKRLENYFNERLDIFDNYDKIYASLAGLYTMLFVKKQQKEIGSNPFLSEIDFDKMDYEKIWKIVEKARAKFNRYSAKKFEYHPNLYKLLLMQRMNISKKLNPDELVYYFSIGMEILPDIYWEDKDSKDNKETEK